jgi:hypothetical protein
MGRNIRRRRLPPFFSWRKAMLNYGRVVLFCGLLTLAAGGCQRGPTWDLVLVEGTVTKDGRPLRGVKVVFLPDTDAGATGPRSSGRTDAAGHYRLRTDNGEDGVVTGKHRVLTLDPQSPKGGKMESSVGKSQLPERAKRLLEQQKTAGNAPRVSPSYAQFKETPLRAEVQPGPQTFDFDLP